MYENPAGARPPAPAADAHGWGAESMPAGNFGEPTVKLQFFDQGVVKDGW